MDERKIRQIIQDEIKRSNAASQFQLRDVTRHTHNGVDSLSIFSPTITYTGFVPSDGDVNSVPFVFLPSGWSVELQTPDVTPIYRITHNLNTSFYSVMACQTGPEGATVIPITVCQTNYFDIAWQNGPTITQQDFHFNLVQVNNKRNSLPTYTLFGT